MSVSGLSRGSDGQPRCAWCAGHDDYVAYHDLEWGFPVRDDRGLLEKLCLEGFQAGLSWLTILRKREAFRRLFAGFDPGRLARFTERDVARIVRDPAIVRHRGKIESAIGNARKTCAVIEEFGSFASYVWRFEPEAASRPTRITSRYLAATTTSLEAKRLAKDLKARGFTFVGPTTVYAFMQAMGLVNDHLDGCAVRAAAQAARRPRTPC